MATKPCVFCAIVSGEATAAVVGRIDDALVFFDTTPVFKGHCLIVPTMEFYFAVNGKELRPAAGQTSRGTFDGPKSACPACMTP